MKQYLILPLAAVAAAGVAQAQEVGRVISSTPVVQQVAVPRQVCTQQPVAVQQQPSGAGAVLGAIAGGAAGNAIGGGSGRAAATAIGLMGGALLGNQIERPGTEIQTVQQCATQTYYENRAVSYNVVYEYAGRQYSVNMPNDPGPTVQLQVTPVGMPPPTSMAPEPAAPVYNAPAAPVYSAPLVVAPPQVVVAPAYPVYYQRPYPYYYPPVSLSIGYVHRSGGHGHRHWR
ncbi:glycine zipper 2TM domain-containing protein [Ramlibacter tataouinensis]|uniref:glycine zipper 2TM domain-containing protein n=1 Tax=Ramlibacter tataouinensis TaxID=94132 RepID=UPI0022F3A036|nr:glycine zipper 2TM domain-containing protein [Ramlibacter tataouinensis]WBY03096.1 glycine zipper 2TM domain-containing protein [Ramlibacter tataouinensis]